MIPSQDSERPIRRGGRHEETTSAVVVEQSDGAGITTQHPVSVVLDNLRSAYNVGNIFRLAEVAGLQTVHTCGYTAHPPHPKLRKTARGCDERVPSHHWDSCDCAIAALKADAVHVIGIETVASATPIWDVSVAFPCAFVFGNEALGLSPETLEQCDQIARLPVFGYKNSLNVSNCAAVVIYAAIQQLCRTANETMMEKR